MKLFTKYSRINLLATIAIFIAASIAFYFTLNYVLINQVDEDLKIEKGEIVAYIEKYNHLPEPIKVRDQATAFEVITSPIKKNHFSTIDMRDSHDDDMEKFRQLTFSMPVANQLYKVTVSKSLEETDHLSRSVLTISFFTILIILFVSFIINRFVLKKLWQPFYHSLGAVKSFRIHKEDKVNFADTSIEEFNFMNKALQTLTNRAQADYFSLKEFSENASHEIQTPIAIIRSKLDLLIQEEGLTQKQSDSLGSAYNAVQRLTTLNQHLLLLARIENNQFASIVSFDLEEDIQKKIADFKELWAAEEIEVGTLLTSSIVKMNRDLANILLNNLLSNATKHNYRGGSLSVTLQHNQLIVKNTSREIALDKEKIFKRFYKPSQTGSSNGLGLSLIKQICDASGFQLNYQYQDQQHIFAVHLSR